MTIARRGLLSAALAAMTPPAIVRASSLMPIWVPRSMDAADMRWSPVVPTFSMIEIWTIASCVFKIEREVLTQHELDFYTGTKWSEHERKRLHDYARRHCISGELAFQRRVIERICT